MVGTLSYFFEERGGEGILDLLSEKGSDPTLSAGHSHQNLLGQVVPGTQT